MFERLKRFFPAALLLPFVGPGCAANDEIVEVPSSPAAEVSLSERPMPPETEAALRACANAGTGRLSRRVYELSFEVQVTPQGTIQAVERRGHFDDTEMGACFVRALQDLPLLGLVPLDESLEPSAQSVSPAQRALLGTTTAALPELVHLAPIVLTPSGVTIVVSVSVIVLVAAVAGQMSKECRREWEEARKLCIDMLQSNNPPRGVTGGYQTVEKCAKGLVSMRCGGNSIDPDGQPARPGRRT